MSSQKLFWLFDRNKNKYWQVKTNIDNQKHQFYKKKRLFDENKQMMISKIHLKLNIDEYKKILIIKNTYLLI